VIQEQEAEGNLTDSSALRSLKRVVFLDDSVVLACVAWVIILSFRVWVRATLSSCCFWRRVTSSWRFGAVVVVVDSVFLLPEACFEEAPCFPI